MTGLGNNPMLSFLFPNALSLDLGYKGAGEQAARQLLGQIEQDLPPLATIAPSHPL